ncbi:hypothetical protein [Rhizobium sp. CAU 1783]
MNAFRSRRHAAAPDIDLLPPDRPRMPHAWPIRVTEDIVDAEFVTVRETTPRRPSDARSSNDNHRRTADRGWAASRPASRRTFAAGILSRLESLLQTLSDKGFAAFVSLVFVAIFALAGLMVGEPGARANAEPLDITHVSLTPHDDDGMRVLQVNAIIENRGTRTSVLPKLRADLIAGGQVIASTYIETPVSEIDAGHSRGITARLLHPGGKMPELRLSFEETGASRS